MDYKYVTDYTPIFTRITVRQYGVTGYIKLEERI